MQLPSHLTVETVAALKRPDLSGEMPLVVDLSTVEHIDSAGVAWLALVARQAKEAGKTLHVEGARPEIERTLAMFPALPSYVRHVPPVPSMTARLGGQVEGAVNMLTAFALLCADAAWFTLMTIAGRFRVRPGLLAYEMAAMGSRALGVVGLIAFLVGATMGLQSAAQLRRFGADIFVVDLIVVSLLRELGPLMAAIVVAGRTGAATAAELGTMVVTEEVDALRTMGLHPVRLLVVPKVIAITIVQPLLTIFANALGILGGFLVAAAYLNVSPDSFIQRTIEIVVFKDIFTGLIKSVVFAWLIVLLGAHYGLTTRGGADAVGRSTTSSVVAGIFAVVVADAFASLIFYFGG
ncbi:MAG: MlaE family lipid ABC transporter permease subunit [Myxococcales bacterium]|nr:MlaE family lipid ABC transporter permease subunit [Myxococcales bacterium]